MAADTLAQPAETALERRAADYVRFREDIAAIEATPFKSAETTREAHRRLSAHKSDALSGGWVAYAALVAADTPAFADALQREAERKRGGEAGKAAFFAKVAEEPSYLRGLRGADAALDRVLGMTAHDAARFAALGEAFKEQAYAMQKTSWGKKAIAAASQRLSDADKYARTRGDAPTPALPAETNGAVTAPMLASASGPWSPDWGRSGRSARAEPKSAAVLDRVLMLASRYALGGLNEKLVASYAKNDHADQCLSMAALVFKQCMAVTRAPYEEAFCIGQHGLNDVANCIGWVAGADSS